MTAWIYTRKFVDLKQTPIKTKGVTDENVLTVVKTVPARLKFLEENFVHYLDGSVYSTGSPPTTEVSTTVISTTEGSTTKVSTIEIVTVEIINSETLTTESPTTAMSTKEHHSKPTVNTPSCTYNRTKQAFSIRYKDKQFSLRINKNG